MAWASWKSPHPGLLPGYREKGKEEKAVGEGEVVGG
jgi:hypothetical protein